MRGKRGEEQELLWNVIIMFIVLSTLAYLFFWMSGASSGALIKSQVDSKQGALMTDSARPGTTFFINRTISIENGKANAVSDKISSEYSYFNLNKISSKTIGNGIEVAVEK